ncbi:TlpA family protein disulfide reductase [Roseivirga sp.]|uniref:TlpA family protein disulfide reductase n=1 Tax=Roseivirga sp. TaxID=1964215 RepID=UPI003B8CBCF2
MKKTVFLLLFLTWFGIHTAQGQVKIEFPKEWKVLSMKEVMENQNFSPNDLIYYGPNGKIIDQKKAAKLLSSQKYFQDFYGNKKGKVVAMHIKAFSKAQLQSIQKFKEDQKALAALVGTPANTFKTVDMEGEGIDISALKGSVIAVNFWFIGCKPCILEMPELNEIVEKYEGQAVKFVAVALDKKSPLEGFLAEKAFEYDIVPDGRSIAELYGIQGYPTHCIIDKEGNIQYFKSGYSSNTAKEVDAKINELLKK